jgi:acetolactate synthase-1/2/3 large subunit
MKRKVSDIVSDFLIEKNITHMFGIIGSGCAHIFDSIFNNNYTNLICTHHEQAAVMAAGTYYRLNNRMSAALLTTGAGSTNGVTGVVNLWMDSIPCVVISGNENSKFTNPENELRVWGIQGYDSTEMVKKVTKYAVRVMEPEDVLFELEKGFHIALTGRPGPVWIDIPMNVQSAMVDVDELRHFEPNEPKLPAISDKSIDEVLERLKRAERPLLWLGHGIRMSGYVDKLEGFLNRIKVPSLVSWAGLDMIPTEHPLNVGRAGLYGQRAGNFVLQNCDYLLTLGTRLAMPQVGYDITELARGARIDVVDIDKKELDKYSQRYNATFHANVAEFLDQMLECLGKESINAPQTWSAYIRDIKKQFPIIGPEHKDSSGFINSYPFMEKLSELLPEKAVVVTDAGTALLAGHQVLAMKKGQRMMTSTALGEMGYGLPGAVGASFGAPDSTVVCLNCDGGMMMNLQELQTVDHHKLPIKIVVFNNDGYLMIKHTQNAVLKGRFSGVNRNTGVTCPDYKKVAHAFNIPYFEVRTWVDFEKNMPDFLGGDGPALCEVFMHPEQLLVPKLSLAMREDGTLVSPPLEDLSPLVSRDVLEKVMIVPVHEKSKGL